MQIRARNVLIFVFLYSFVGMGIADSFPEIIFLRYISDLLIVFLLFFIFYTHNFKVKHLGYSIPVILVLLFFITLLSYPFVSNDSPIFYLWGFRNLFKWFILWWAGTIFFEKNDFFLLSKILLTFVVLNTPIMLFQGLVLNWNQDIVGGISGLLTGVNAFTNIQIIMACILAISLYSLGKINLKIAFIVLVCCLTQAAIAELKFFYIEFIFILFILFCFIENKAKIVPLYVIALIIFSLAVSLIAIFYPVYDGFFLNSENYINASESNYAERSDLGIDRGNAIPLILDHFLKSPIQKMLGLGLGVAEPCAFMKSNFIVTYGSSHINLFVHGVTLLESGLCGLFLYYLFFILIIVKCLRGKNNSIISPIGITICSLSILVSFYNLSLRMDSGIPIFIFLSFFVLRNQTNSSNVDLL